MKLERGALAGGDLGPNLPHALDSDGDFLFPRAGDPIGQDVDTISALNQV